MKIAYGVMCNDREILKQSLLKSEIEGPLHIVFGARSAACGLNKLLLYAEADKADAAVIVHQDVVIPMGWKKILESRLKEIDGWLIAGVWGMLSNGTFVGNVQDIRLGEGLSYRAGSLPAEVVAVDELCIVIRPNRGFKFDTAMTGFHLYGTYACLRAAEIGGKAFAIDASVLHNASRSFDWKPDQSFMTVWSWLKTRFPGRPVISTVYAG